jgi:hypothetical protein
LLYDVLRGLKHLTLRGWSIYNEYRGIQRVIISFSLEYC